MERKKKKSLFKLKTFYIKFDIFAARIELCNTWSSGGTPLCRVGGATTQLDLPSLTPLSVASCGRLQLGAPPLGYFGKLLQVVDN